MLFTPKNRQSNLVLAEFH